MTKEMNREERKMKQMENDRRDSINLHCLLLADLAG